LRAAQIDPNNAQAVFNLAAGYASAGGVGRN
jgi:hypothetical protein